MNTEDRDPRTENRKLRAAVRCCAAFTLIELLTVITIIGILAAITIGTASIARRKAFTSRTKAEIAAMENALEQFKNDNGFFPQRSAVPPDDRYSSTIIYNALAGGAKTYMTFKSNQLAVVKIAGIPYTNIVDAGGVYYRYLCPGTNNVATFDLWSYGPDGTNRIVAGKNRDLDNITNWQQH